MSAESGTHSPQVEGCRQFLGLICWETGRDARNLRRFAIWLLVTALSREAINFIELQVSMPVALAWGLAFLPTLPAALTITAYCTFLREADEMIRRIHLTALAAGCGAAFFVFMAFQAPLSYGVPFPYKDVLALTVVHKALVFMAMTFGWVIGQSVAARRYK